MFSPLYSQTLGLDIFFEGHEKDKYNTNFVGLTAINQPNKKLQLKWMLSYFNDNEEENIDITGAYLFGEREYDPVTGAPNGVEYRYANHSVDTTLLNCWQSYQARNIILGTTEKLRSDVIYLALTHMEPASIKLSVLF